LWAPPEAGRLAAVPYHVFHRFNVERHRADTIRRVCRHADRLEEAATMTPADAHRRLQAVDGVGVWTSNVVLRVAIGDPDAVAVGDAHLPHTVAWFLAGEARATDERMLELLAPFAGHRARAVTLIQLAGSGAPRFGPGIRLVPIARL
jgi:3-methyladenine DNA glycosylase/8-oxoguanine DNA glycosylase